MKSFKPQRSIWTFAGLCFLLSTILSDDKIIGLRSVFKGIAYIAPIINAYNVHKGGIE